MLGVYIPPSSSSSSSLSNGVVDGATINDNDHDERRSGRRPRLGASDTTLGEDDYDYDVDSDEDYRQFLTEKEICAVNAISSQAALDAIGLIRRNIDNDGGEDEMDEEDMVNVVAKALYERGFQSAAAIMIEISVKEKEDDSNSDDGAPFGTAMTLSLGLVVESKKVTNNLPSSGPQTTGAGGAWSSTNDQQIIEDVSLAVRDTSLAAI